MLEKLKMKLAARRVQSNKRTRRTKRASLWVRIWNAICWPFRKIAQFARWVWKKICQFARWAWGKICAINFIGLLNAALLVAIFVLCTMLIINLVNCRKKPVVIVTNPISATVNQPSTVAEPTTKVVSTRAKYIRPRTNTLPIARDAKTNTMMAEPIRTTHETINPVTEKQIAKIGETMHGDIIIENRGDAKLLNNGTQIDGNLYLQNMRKYVLPCDIKVTGNMFVRDVNMLQFCGDFEVTGNIYVSPRSSFGPIPRTATLGGQVIL